MTRKNVFYFKADVCYFFIAELTVNSHCQNQNVCTCISRYFPFIGTSSSKQYSYSVSVTFVRFGKGKNAVSISQILLRKSDSQTFTRVMAGECAIYKYIYIYF